MKLRSAVLFTGKILASFVAFAGLSLLLLWWQYDHVAAWVLEPQKAYPAMIEDSEFALVTLSGDHFGLNQLEDAVKETHAQGGGAADSPLIVFVHGFGPNPDGEFGLYTLKELSDDAGGADVIMFQWPSWVSVQELPTLNAVVASEKLAELILEVGRLAQPGGLLDGRDITFVGHSMAGEVFRNLAASTRPLPENVVSKLLLAVPETALEGHRFWMNKLKFCDHVFVFVNENDPALQVTTLLYKSARLGRSLVSLDGVPEPLADNASYIILDAESWRHYFFVSGQRNDVIDTVFSNILANGVGALETQDLEKDPDQPIYAVVKDIDADGT